MIIYNGKKYACVSCIRGHRSSQCDHRERPLIQVRKRGRPLPDNKRQMLPKETVESNGNILTDTFVFEPVGDGLYRKHLRSEYPEPVEPPLETPDIPAELTPKSPFSASFDNDPQLIAPMNLNQEDLIQRLGVTQEEIASIWPQGEQSIIPSCVIPNQCHCGDTCSCPDCYTHGNRVQ